VVLLGLVLIAVGGWPVLVIGVLSMVAGVTYTGGPWPYGYRGLGDVFVFVFFGLVAVLGTYYLQTGGLSAAAVAAALPMACTVTAILVVNNLRDVDTDRGAGKRTLAVIMGPRMTRFYYALLMVAPIVLVSLAVASSWLPPATLGLWLALVPIVVVVRQVVKGAAGPQLNPILKRTALLHLLLGVLLCVGVLV